MSFIDADPEKQGSNDNVASTGSSENVIPKEASLRPIHGWKVADIQPVILDLFGEVSLLPWIGVGFALGTMCVLPWGKVYGVFNVKYVYLFNITLFEIGSAVCGAAPNMTALVVGRVIAGVGGSGIVDPQPSKSWAEKCRMIDWIMTTMFLAGSASLVMAITFGGTLYDWSSGNEIALWVVAGVLLVVCIVLAKYHPGVDKDNRLYPAHFFKRPILVNLQLQMFLVSGIVLVCNPSLVDIGLSVLTRHRP
ncbi:unnamed protein product [Aspergillus oryzae var. brunneus]|uniref:Unnamed protein product n=1 Tax=Aspergillus oryzae var. brunneus TaxID=332754 RepID=A0ABQ6L858_ASPOZ|nr:unnamed protein product [Aspergillus oryzae var. brunneus]